MPTVRVLRITCEVYEDLLYATQHHPKAYVREQASALCKIADGVPAARVASAAYGLTKRRPDTLYAWMDRVEAEGVAGLLVKPGRGRKPAFSPCAAERR